MAAYRQKRAWAQVQIEFDLEFMVPFGVSIDEAEKEALRLAKLEAGKLSSDITRCDVTDIENDKDGGGEY